MNPLYKAMGGPQQGGPMNFVQFMNQMKRQDPQALIDQAVSRYGINQNQLNQIQQQAKQMEGQFGQFKSMFGFR